MSAAKTKSTANMDEFFLRSGFHKHKQSHRGKGLYFSVGGYDITKADAIAIYKQHLNAARAAIGAENEIVATDDLIEDLSVSHAIQERLKRTQISRLK